MKAKPKGIQTYIRNMQRSFEDKLGEMVEIPSISMDPTKKKDLRRMASLAVQYLREYGAKARIVETGGAPVVSGGWTTGASHPTVTIYNHLDVQPAQEPEWRQSPFSFKKKDGVYHGRGATDDKGPALSALMAARYAVEEGVPLNIRFLWELEEEIGSPNFGKALAKSRDVPKPDSVLVSDTIWISKHRPAMPYGLRGLLAVRMTLQTGEVGAHSGVTGGAARNPLAELMDVVTACVDARTGRVKIPGFYEGAKGLTPFEVKNFLKSGFNVNRFMKAYGFRTMRTKNPEEVLRRIWGQPTFEVHGLVGGYSGPGVKTVVPAHGELKVSMRLVPNQQPKKILALLKRFVAARNPDIRIEVDGMLEPFLSVCSGPYAEAACRASRVGFGKEPSFIREGGSIGAAVMLQRAWRVPILFMGLSLPEHGYHAPNECFDWGQASRGMRAFHQYFIELASMK